ncbi:class I lanthipeptide [Aquimarina sp. Aq107]|nr:class I lanthipeptide [Aquimarina sp. Aq107]
MKKKKDLKLEKLTIAKLNNDQKIKIKGGVITGVGGLSDVSDTTLTY